MAPVNGLLIYTVGAIGALSCLGVVALLVAVLLEMVSRFGGREETK